MEHVLGTVHATGKSFEGLFALHLTVENGRITRIYAIRNPHKLTRLGVEAQLGR